MARIVYVTATSLDGFLADADGSLDWLFAVDGGPQAIEEDRAFLRRARVQVMGSTTYRWVVEHEGLVADPGRWQEFYGDRKTFAFTSRTDLPVVVGADVEFVGGPVVEHLDAILAAAGDGDVHLVGGGALAAQFADIGRLDAIQLSIAPVTLGAGAPLLSAYLDSARLRLADVHRTGQFIRADYEVLPLSGPSAIG